MAAQARAVFGELGNLTRDDKLSLAKLTQAYDENVMKLLSLNDKVANSIDPLPIFRQAVSEVDRLVQTLRVHEQQLLGSKKADSIALMATRAAIESFTPFSTI